MKLYIFMLRTRFFFTRRWAESSAWHMAVNRGRWQSWFMPRSSINHVDPQRSIDHNLFSSSSRLQTKTIPPSISIEISSGGVLIEWILNIKKKRKFTMEVCEVIFVAIERLEFHARKCFNTPLSSLSVESIAVG